jgi:hypothetical protein
MAWIAMNTTLPHSPKIGAIALRLGVHHMHALGAAMSVWAWADSATADGFVPFATREIVDRQGQTPNICEAMEAVGWIEVTSGGVLFSDWSKHNGNNTKSRMLAAERQRRRRSPVTVERDKCHGTSVTKTLPQNRTEQNRTTAASAGPDAAVGRAAAAAAVVLTDEEIKARAAYLRRRPDWLPDGRPWIEPSVIAELAAMPLLDQATVDCVYRVAREGRLTMRNPAGLVVKRLRAAGGAK